MAKTYEANGQKITTHYDDAQKQKEGIQHHSEQAEKMRKLRNGQESKYEKAKRVIAPKLRKAREYVKERSEAIAHETRDVRATRKQRYSGSVPSSGIPGMNSDPFNIGALPHAFANPFASPRPEPAPRRRKRRKASRPAPRRRAPHRQQPHPGGMDMGIPKHMRWMF